jgi:hypothetical protein
MDTSNLDELKRQAKFRCERLREEIENSGHGMKEIELTVIEAESTITLIEALVAKLEV